MPRDLVEKGIFSDLHFNSLLFLFELFCCTVQIFSIITFLIIFDVGRVMSPHFCLGYQNLIVVNPLHFLLQGAIRFNGAVILTFSNWIGNQFLVIGLAAYSGLEDPLTICIFIHTLFHYDFCSDYLYLHGCLEVS